MDTERLLAENTQLDRGQRELSSSLERLSECLKQLEMQLTSLREQRASASRLIAASSDGSTSTTLELDTLVTGTNAAATELLHLHAENLALDDTIYTVSKLFLDQKPTDKAMSLSVCLRHLRELAREQFMTRALFRKIRSEHFPPVPTGDSSSIQ